MTYHYTANGISKTLNTVFTVAKTSVAINPVMGQSLGRDIEATVDGGYFEIKNTGVFDWQSPSVTRDASDTWLTVNTGGTHSKPNCKDVSSVAPGDSCVVNYTIVLPHDLAAVVTAEGVSSNIVDTSQDLAPNEYVSIGIEGDNALTHLTARALKVTNLTTGSVTLSAIVTALSNPLILQCDHTGTNCPQAMSTCYNGAVIPSGW